MKQPSVCLIIIAAVAFPVIGFSANPADLNQDGRITFEEFETLKKNDAAKNGKTISADQIKFNFQEKDLDEDGALSIKELSSNPFDPDGDKKITPEEFSAVMKKRAKRAGKETTDDQIKVIFAKKDTDGDGSLSFEELAKPVK